MFTVLIAEESFIGAIRQGNKLFFEPFLENKELAFCPWHPGGQTLEEAVPGLTDIVGRRKDWRVVIVNNSTIARSKTQNPFDVVDCSALDALVKPNFQPEYGESWDKWEQEWKEYYRALATAKEAVYRSALEEPFQKLTTWLCFRPEDYVLNDVQGKQDVEDWVMEMLGRDDLKHSTKLELMERDEYKFETRLKENLRREFVAGKFMNVAYPSEVYCVSPRSAENNYFDPEAFWNIRQESAYSTFADRNMYFDRMRFMVFDMLSVSHRNFRADFIRFLATLLIFASNPIPGSAMQARRLYRLEVESDDKPLRTLVTSYDRKLAATADVIENEMDKIRSEIPEELTDKEAEAMFCTPTEISVVLDSSCDPEKVCVEKDYGLFYDSPEDEHHKWNRDYGASEKALSYIVRQQSRSVRRSVIQTHNTSAVSDGNISRLTVLQLDDIREFTDTAEDEMIASIPAPLAEAAHGERIAREAETVKKVISRRMTRKTAVILSLLCIGLYLCCFLPFLFANSATSQTTTTAMVLSLAVIAVFALILFVSLFFLRSTLRKAVKGYNDTAKEIMNEIQSSMKQISKYLSASCSVRRGHTVQSDAKKKMDEYTLGLRIRKKHLDDIRKKRAYLAESYRDFLGDRSSSDETMSRPYEYDFDQRTEYDYPAPFLAGDCRQIEFISTGNMVTVPSSYITRMLTRLEEIYEQ